MPVGPAIHAHAPIWLASSTLSSWLGSGNGSQGGYNKVVQSTGPGYITHASIWLASSTLSSWLGSGSGLNSPGSSSGNGSSPAARLAAFSCTVPASRRSDHLSR